MTQRTKGTILIVDDDESILKIIPRELRQENVKVLTAKDAKEALAILATEEVHLVMSDQRMPGMSGIEFLKKVKFDYPEIVTIMMTAYTDIEVAAEAINSAGVYKFILKPWEPAQLRMMVNRALELRNLIMERDSLREKIKEHEAVLQQIEKRYPGITQVDRDEEGNVILNL